MEVNWVAALVAAVAMFAVGAVWYMALFGKLWGKIHGFDKLDKKTQKEMQSQMGPYYAVQIVLTLLSAVIISSLASQMPTVSLYRIVFVVWLGFVMPAEVSAVLFGGTEKKWMSKKIAIMVSESLIRLLVAAWVVALIQ